MKKEKKIDRIAVKPKSADDYVGRPNDYDIRVYYRTEFTAL